MTQLRIRWMVRSDFPAVISIDERSYWQRYDEETLIKTIQQPDYVGVVGGWEADDVLAFMIYRSPSPSNHLGIEKLAVHPAYRRHGIGSAMLNYLKNKLHSKRHRILSDTADFNLPGQLFLSSQGFRAVGVTRGVSTKPHIDIYHFEFKCLEEVNA